MPTDSNDEILFYAVKNREGKYFHAKGYNGHGETWVDELKKARVWARIAPARAQITFFSKTYPEYGVPDLVILKVSDIQIVDESVRVQKTISKHETQTLERKAKELEAKKMKLEKEITRKRDQLNKLRGQR